MMAREHSESGLVVGLAVADFAHLPIPAGLALAILTTGAALLPDLDHPSATAARSFGPITEVIAAGLDTFGLAVWNATSTEYDRRPRDGHRTITHTIVFAAIAGVLFGLLSAQGGARRWGLAAVLFVLASLAVRGLMPRRAHRDHTVLGITLISAALAAAAYFLVPAVDPLLVGECVALGCWVHCLGDSLTLYGCPWLWPIPIKGQRWYLIGTPHFLRFRTGTAEFDGEDRVRILMHIALPFLLLGLLPHSYTMIGHGVSHLVVALTH